jgi:hypothetical protein
MANYNKNVEQLVRTSWENHALQGFWAKANYAKTDHGTSFYLFERVDLEKAYYYIAHEWIKEHVDPAGLYTKKRNSKFWISLAEMLAKAPWNESNLKVGQKVWLKPIREISKHYRQGEIGQVDMVESDGIVDLVNCVEDHGYNDTYGSCYSWEIVIVRDTDGNYHPFEAKKQEANND